MGVLERELEYHEKLYSGFAQTHFAKPAVRALRAHMVSRILDLTGAGKASRVLSLGCGIGDTELLLAPHVSEVVGLDLSPAAVRFRRCHKYLYSPQFVPHKKLGRAVVQYWPETQSPRTVSANTWGDVLLYRYRFGQ